MWENLLIGMQKIVYKTIEWFSDAFLEAMGVTCIFILLYAVNYSHFIFIYHRPFF